MNTKLEVLIKNNQRKQAEWEERQAQLKAEREEAKTIMNRKIMPNLRTALSKDYKRWLKGFLAAGGAPTHYYDYSMPDNFYVATKGFTMIPLFGSLGIHIIVPDGIEVSGDLGHCNLFFMDGFKHRGGWTPVYENTIV